MCRELQMYRGFLLTLILFIACISDCNSTMGTPFWEDIESKFRKGDYTAVQNTIRNNLSEFEETSQGTNKAQLYLLGTQDYWPLFRDDVQKQHSLEASFLGFLQEEAYGAFPTYLLEAFWHFKRPIAQESSPNFPEAYDPFFFKEGAVTREPKIGAGILKNPRHNSTHSRYWLAHWNLENRKNELQIQGRGMITQLAEEGHRRALMEENLVHRNIRRHHQPGWSDGFGGWCICPGRRLCPSSTDDGCDVRRFDFAACCGYGDLRRNKEYQVNCGMCGVWTRWSEAEVWRHWRRVRNKVCACGRQSLMGLGGTLSTVSGVLSTVDVVVPGSVGPWPAITGLMGPVIFVAGFSCSDGNPPEEVPSRRRETITTAPSAYGSQERGVLAYTASEFPTSADPSAYPSAYPSALPSGEPSEIVSVSPAPQGAGSVREPQRHHSAPEPETRPTRGWLRESLSAIRGSFKKRTAINAAPCALSSVEAGLLSPPPLITNQPQRTEGPDIFVKESELGGGAFAAQSRSHLVPSSASHLSIVSPSRRPPYARDDDEEEKGEV